jgi:hypothetical protein
MLLHLDTQQDFNRTNDFLDVVCFNISDNICSGLSVCGRLSACKQWWYDNLQLSKLVINVLEFGYEIPFVEEPLRCYLKNNANALKNSEFVIEAITALIAANCVTEFTEVPYCCNSIVARVSFVSTGSITN